MRILIICLGIVLILFSCQKLEEKCFMETGEVISSNGLRAIVKGSIVAQGAGPVISVGHCWTLENRSPTIEDNTTTLSAPDLNAEFFDTLPNLSPNQTYNFRTYGIIEGQSPCYGELKTFQTKGISLTTESLQFSSNFASVVGRISGVSSSDITEVGHCWSSETETPTIDRNEGKSNVSFDLVGDITYSSTIENLNNGLRYYIRAYAIIEDKVLYGNIENFAIENIWEESPTTLFRSEGAIAFTIGTDAYIGLGFAEGRGDLNNFVKLSPDGMSTNLTPFPGKKRVGAVAFSLNDKGYVGLGVIGNTCEMLKDFWVYDPISDQWDSLTISYPGQERYFATSFVIKNKAYVGLGRKGCDQGVIGDFWAFNPNTNTPWVEIPNANISARMGAVNFVIGDKAYIGTGMDNNGNFLADFWEFNPNTTNQATWLPLKDFGGGARLHATAFAIQEKGYVGTGRIGDFYNQDLWQYIPETNEWIEKAPIIGAGRYLSVGFSLKNKGFIGLGTNNTILASQTLSDMYIYIPVSD